MSQRFVVGDRVRIDIPDETDPEFTHHRKRGTVVAVREDDADDVTGDTRDRYLYEVQLSESEATVALRWRDLRPVL